MSADRRTSSTGKIPQDFDIHLGVMWMRAGTRTANAPSGTIHEFRQAVKRREATGRPIIMFDFSDERPAALFRTSEELGQMAEVLKFREELAQIGLTTVYPDRESFRERVRGGLLRALADVLTRVPAARVERPSQEAPETEVPPKIAELARAYDEARKRMASGPARTQRMTEIVGSMVAEAPAAIRALELLKAASRQATALRPCNPAGIPQEEQLDWLAERLHPEHEKPFVGYQAATSIAQAVRSLPEPADHKLETAIDRAMTLARRNPDDPPRIMVLEQAQRELMMRRKRSPT